MLLGYALRNFQNFAFIWILKNSYIDIDDAVYLILDYAIPQKYMVDTDKILNMLLYVINAAF